MKRLLISPQFPPACCGVGDFTFHLAQAMQDRGQEVTVLTEPMEGDRPRAVPVMEAPLRGWRNLRGALQTIRSSGCAHVQIEYSAYGWGRWGFSFAFNALLFALRARGVKVTLGLHELFLPFTIRPFGLACGLIQRIHFALLFLAAREIATNTPQRVRTVRRWLPWRANRVHFRPTPSNIPFVPIASQRREELRAKRGATRDTTVVVLFGTFHPAKNYEAAIDAALQLRPRIPLQLWFLGNQRMSTAYVEGLKRRAEPLGARVFWSGPAPASEVSAWLQAADVFLLPQADGNLTRSGAFMAAAAHGLPVVAVRNDAEQAMFQHEENVWLAERSSAEGFTGALESLAVNASLRAQLGSHLRDLYYSRFDWPHLVAGVAPRQATSGSVSTRMATQPEKSKA